MQFKRGLEAMGKPGMCAAAQARSMHVDQRLDEKTSIDRRKAMEAQADPIGAFIRGETLPILDRRLRMYALTEPHRMMEDGCRSMAPGSGRVFFRECRACRSKPCLRCGQRSHLLVWIADDGSLEAEDGSDHQTCPTTCKDPRMSDMLPECCACGVDVCTRARDIFSLMNVVDRYGDDIL